MITKTNNKNLVQLSKMELIDLVLCRVEATMHSYNTHRNKKESVISDIDLIRMLLEDQSLSSLQSQDIPF